MVNLIILLTVGGVIGWLTSLAIKAEEQQTILLNIAVGSVGSALGGFLLAPLVGLGTVDQTTFSIDALFVPVVGAIILLAVVNLFNPGAVR